jgi:hypothetical protein
VEVVSRAPVGVGGKRGVDPAGALFRCRELEYVGSPREPVANCNLENMFYTQLINSAGIKPLSVY